LNRYPRFFAAGGDWGGRVTAALGHRHPDRVTGLHSFTPYVPEPADSSSYGPLTARENEYLVARGEFFRLGRGYSLEQSTRPQTVGYFLTDSPVAQLTWLLDKFWAWTDHDGDPRGAISQGRMLDLVTFYWLSGTARSSARFYWENFPPDNSGTVPVPSAVTIFPARHGESAPAMGREPLQRSSLVPGGRTRRALPDARGTRLLRR